jgi:hypothetical protein
MADRVALPVVRGDAEHEAVVAALRSFLERHAPMGQAGPWVACLCGWGHDTVTHAEHVAATMAAQRPWAVGPWAPESAVDRAYRDGYATGRDHGRGRRG